MALRSGQPFSAPAVNPEIRSRWAAKNINTIGTVIATEPAISTVAGTENSVSWAVTAATPARELYGSLPGYDEKAGIMEANILVGFAWNDRPWTAATAIVVQRPIASLKIACMTATGQMLPDDQRSQA